MPQAALLRIMHYIQSILSNPEVRPAPRWVSPQIQSGLFMYMCSTQEQDSPGLRVPVVFLEGV